MMGRIARWWRSIGEAARREIRGAVFWLVAFVLAGIAVGYLMRIAALLTAMTAAGQGATPFHPSNARDGLIVIDSHNGGNVIMHRVEIMWALEAGHRIEIRDRCMSACAMILEHREAIRSGQIVISPRATFGIHAARNAETGLIDRPMTEYVMRHYPQSVLRAARVPGPDQIGLRMHLVHGRDLSAAIQRGE
ncbi:MAG: hypothetical protein ACQRW7_11490 [Caulobacterales bacterium]|uniref:hypothetical protein n=1 Tax=Glycocaulis sp. TaxID=1969725 RepID=UPI003F9FFA6F